MTPTREEMERDLRELFKMTVAHDVAGYQSTKDAFLAKYARALRIAAAVEDDGLFDEVTDGMNFHEEQPVWTYRRLLRERGEEE
jgi:hypothetical protein